MEYTCFWCKDSNKDLSNFTELNLTSATFIKPKIYHICVHCTAYFSGIAFINNVSLSEAMGFHVQKYYHDELIKNKEEFIKNKIIKV
jgi:hypothetical protein